MKNITFITTGQPTTNPRLVKEVGTLIGLGYDVKVICCFYQPWAQKFDQQTIGTNNKMYIYCGGDPYTKKLTYYKTRIRQKLFLKLFKFLKLPGIAENAISRTHAEALLIAKRIKTDLYIAHNLGALPAAIIAAKYSNAKIGYDAEDMHSGQFVSNNDVMYLLNKYIEEKYFKQTDYFTAASPLIGKYYKHTYSYLNPVIIDNVFPKTNLLIRQNHNGQQPLKLFWFSQTIGSQRGIETIIEAMSLSASQSELHLLGNCSTGDKYNLLEVAEKHHLNKKTIYFHEPVAPDNLFKFATQFDIGMSTENASTLNRDICLTNKIFTYVQSGLAVIASDTQAQSLFFQQYSHAGKIYKKNDANSLANCIDRLAEDPAGLFQIRQKNYQLGQTMLHWENESDKFVQLVKETLNNAQ